MHRFLPFIAIMLASALLTAGCGDSNDDGATGDGSSGSSGSPSSAGAYGSNPEDSETTASGGSGGSGGSAATVATTGDGELGTFLVDSDGRTLYLFEKDEGPRSTCYGKCADAWPPLISSGEPKPSGKTDAALLGTSKRRDGTAQVTYDGHPLYYFAADEQPGDANGQDVDGFGAEWYVVAPDGGAVEGES